MNMPTQLWRVSCVLCFALGMLTARTYAFPISGSATGSVVHDGGFGGPVHSFGPYDLDYAWDPPLTVFSHIPGEYPNYSDGAVGGSKYYDPSLAVLKLANGSFLSQYAPVSPHGPATGTVSFSALFEVGDWRNIYGFYDLPVWGHVGAGQGAYVALSLDVHLFSYVLSPTGIRSDILKDVSVQDSYVDNTPGSSFSVVAHRESPLPDIIPEPGGSGYIGFWGTLSATVMDPEGETSVNYSLNVSNSVVPEPSTYVLISTGAIALFGYSFRRRLKPSAPEPRRGGAGHVTWS